jgi:nitrite reductase/ring-hydroxylating ferredoxin subunit
MTQAMGIKSASIENASRHEGGMSRRAFLDGSAGCAVALIAAMGLNTQEALALPIMETLGERAGNEWRSQIPASDSVNIDHKAQVILARAQGHVFVFNLACPHQKAAVKWLPADNRFQCTKHNSKYTPDGAYIAGRATRNLDRFAVRRDGNLVVADLDRLIQSDKDAAGWAAAMIPV